jgi:hypothetical protein
LKNVEFRESTTNTLLGSGHMGYFLGNNNEFFGYFAFSTWNPGIFNGTIDLNITSVGNNSYYFNLPNYWYF